MKTQEINIRDPFILPFDGKYYLYGTRGDTCWGVADGFDVYISSDLEEWEGPIVTFQAGENFWADRHFWAPEVHQYKGRFYMFASFKAENAFRGTQILVSNTPKGPFEIYTDAPITPKKLECLDGTLYINKQGKPYIVFCNEWTQITDGSVCVMPLSDDLTKAIGEPIVLFHGSDPDWADKDAERFVTDGPFLYRAENGELLMIWSSGANGKYIQAVSRSNNGEIDGKWTHDKELLFADGGGHGMIFKTFDDKLMLNLHSPNSHLDERPIFFELEEKEGKLFRN